MWDFISNSIQAMIVYAIILWISSFFGTGGIVFFFLTFVGGVISQPLEYFDAGKYAIGAGWYSPVFFIAAGFGIWLIYQTFEEKKELNKKKVTFPMMQELPFIIQQYINANGYQSKANFLNYCNSLTSFADARNETYKISGNNSASFDDCVSFYYEKIIVVEYKNAFCRKAISCSQFTSGQIYQQLPEFHEFFSTDGQLFQNITLEALDKMIARGWIQKHDMEDKKSSLYDTILSSPNSVFAELENPVYERPNTFSFENDTPLSKIPPFVWYIIWGCVTFFLILIALA